MRQGWAVELSEVRETRQWIAASVIPERRSLIRERSELKRLPFCGPGSALRLAGMTIRWAD